MAFSKAKILRFNDVASCAPPPGAYNPKFDDHVLGSVVYTKDKEPQSPASSTSDLRSINSAMSAPNFRTPTVPRRKKIAMPNSVGNKNNSSILFDSQSPEALREKIVECSNKDETIADLESQLEDLKLTINTLNIQKNNLILERDETTVKLRDITEQLENVNKQLIHSNLKNQTIVDKYDNMKSELKAQNAAEMKQLQENLNLLQDRLKINLNEYETILKDTEEQIENTKEKYSKLEKEFIELREKYSVLEIKYDESIKAQTDLQNYHSSQMEMFKRLQEKEAGEFDSELIKIVTEWKKTVKQIEDDHEIKINVLEIKQKTEIETLKKEMMSEKTKLLENIIDLKSNMENISTELNSTKIKLKEEINTHQKDKAKTLAEKHCYEITLNKTYDTVNALKNRLLNSDKYVEQLSKELETLEGKKFESDEKIIEENDHLKKMNEELKADNEALLTIQENVIFLEHELFDKIDNFKSKAGTEITRLTGVIDKQSNELKKLHSYIQDQQNIHSSAYNLVENARTEIDKLESEATEYRFKISRLETALNEKEKVKGIEEFKDKQIKELKDKLKERDQEMNELASIYKKYIEKSRQYEEMQQKHEELQRKLQQLEKKIAEQDALIGPFRDQLENYERECQILLLHKGAAEKEAKEMGLKYAEILGHQNYKQKLKHMVDLKRRNIDLMECKQNYETKMMHQNRTIEKLKQKITQMNKTKTIDKENVGSSVQMTNIQSPIALKERN